MKNSCWCLATLDRVAIVAAIGALALCGQTQSMVQGTLQDASDGSPVTGMPIVAIGVPSAVSEAPMVFRTSSDGSGLFSLAVPVGRYWLCVEESRLYVDPCQWSPGSSEVVAPAPSPVVVKLAQGVRIVVQLADPDAKLAALSSSVPNLAGIPAPPLTATVTDAAGNRRLIPFGGARDSIYEFATLIPATGRFTLEVTSGYLSLTDETGAPLAGNAYSSALDTSAIVNAWASTPPWTPLWLSPSRGLPSKTFGLTVYGLLQ